MRVLYEESVSGRAVVDSTGQVIGVIDGLVMDTVTLQIDALRVRLDKSVAQQIGAPHGLLRAGRLDVPSDFIQSVGDTVVLKGPVGTLRTFEQQPSP